MTTEKSSLTRKTFRTAAIRSLFVSGRLAVEILLWIFRLLRTGNNLLFWPSATNAASHSERVHCIKHAVQTQKKSRPPFAVCFSFRGFAHSNPGHLNAEHFLSEAEKLRSRSRSDRLRCGSNPSLEHLITSRRGHGVRIPAKGDLSFCPETNPFAGGLFLI